MTTSFFYGKCPRPHDILWFQNTLFVTEVIAVFVGTEQCAHSALNAFRDLPYFM